MSDDQRVQTPPGACSPEQRCPICLEDFEDKAFVNACFHPFCFVCIVQWSEVANSCPMCKTTFQSVIHNIKSNDNYEKFEIRAKPISSQQEVSLTEARRFRYRSTRVPGRPGSPRHRHYVRQSRRAAVAERRKAVYSAGLRALPLEVGERRQRVRNITAAFFRENPACSHRLFPWLSREFKALLGQEHVEFMLQIVMSLLDKVDLESEDFASHLEPFLHDKTAHFMHELLSFARSPYDMIAYDGKVSYDWPGGSAPGRENWGPETSLNPPEHSGSSLNPPEHSGSSLNSPEHSGSSPGPSGLPSAADMQNRILEELTTARWDDSPPILPSSSPIVIHGSDSEPEEYGARSPVHAPVHNPVHDPQSPAHESRSLPHDSVEPSSVNISQEVNRTESCPPRIPVTDISSEVQSQSRAAQNSAAPEVSSTTVTIESLPITAVASTGPSPPPAKHSQSQGGPLEESFILSVHVENMGELDASSASTANIKDRAKTSALARSSKSPEQEQNVDKGRGRGEGRRRRSGRTPRREDHETLRLSSDDSFSESEDRAHSFRPHRRSRHNDGHYYSHRNHRRPPSPSSDGDHGYHGSRRRKHHSREHRRHDMELKRERSPRRYGIGGKSYGDHDYERCSDAYSAADAAYYRREGQLHRSRLYSDDLPCAGTSSGHLRERKRNSSDAEPSSPDDHRRQYRRRSQHRHPSKEKKRGSRRSRDRSRESHRSGNGPEREKRGKQSVAKQQLSQELSELEGRIQDNKKQLLRSLLQRERLEFLHTALQSEKVGIDNLYPEESSHRSTEITPPLSISRDINTTDDMVKELAFLDRAITDGKKQILRVVKRMEEQQGAADSDTDSS